MYGWHFTFVPPEHCRGRVRTRSVLSKNAMGRNKFRVGRRKGANLNCGRVRRHMAQLPNDQHITYQLQYRKCGKSSCKTCRDGKGHGPYWYAYWREGARLRSGYIGKTAPDTIISSDTTTDASISSQHSRTVSVPDIQNDIDETNRVSA
jgi:hypothetical protein